MLVRPLLITRFGITDQIMYLLCLFCLHTILMCETWTGMKQILFKNITMLQNHEIFFSVQENEWIFSKWIQFYFWAKTNWAGLRTKGQNRTQAVKITSLTDMKKRKELAVRKRELGHHSFLKKERHFSKLLVELLSLVHILAIISSFKQTDVFGQHANDYHIFSIFIWI